MSETLSEILEDWGCATAAVFSGEEALTAIESELPQVCIIDIGLPDMSGHDLAAEIRDRFGSASYLIALTGYGHTESLRDAKASGFDRHMKKPPDFDQLRQVLVEAEAAISKATNND